MATADDGSSLPPLTRWHTVQDVLEHVAEFTGDLRSLLEFRRVSQRALLSVKQAVARLLRRHRFAVDYAEDQRNGEDGGVVLEPLGPAGLDALDAQVVGARGAAATALRLVGARAVRHAFGFVGGTDRSSNEQLYTAALAVLLSPLCLPSSPSSATEAAPTQLQELHRGSSADLPRLLRKRWAHFAPALASGLTQLWLQPCNDSATTSYHDGTSYVTDGLLHNVAETLAASLEVLCVSSAEKTTPGGLLALTALTKLRRLYLRGTEGVTDLVVNSILAAIPDLEHLGVAGAPVTEHAFELTARPQQRQHALTSLDASCCIYLGNGAFVEALAKLFPHLAVLLLTDSGSEVPAGDQATPEAWSALGDRLRVFGPHAKFRGDMRAWPRLTTLVAVGKFFIMDNSDEEDADHHAAGVNRRAPLPPPSPPLVRHMSWGDMAGLAFTPRCLQRALAYFGGAPKLETLSVDDSRPTAPGRTLRQLGGGALFPAADSFASLSTMRTFAFRARMTTASCAAFFAAATGLTSITVRFDDASSAQIMISAIAAALPANQLRALDVDNVRADALAACDIIERHAGSLSALRLRIVGGIDEAEPSVLLGAAIGRCLHLRTLDIDSIAQAPRRDLSCLAPIGRLEHLNEFALTANGALPDGLFCGGSFPRLRCLRLVLFSLSDKTVVQVCRKFPWLEDLRFIIVQSAELTDDGIAAVAQLRALRTLAFLGCPRVSQRGLLRLKRALPRETRVIDNATFFGGSEFRQRIRLASLSDNMPSATVTT